MDQRFYFHEFKVNKLLVLIKLKNELRLYGYAWYYIFCKFDLVYYFARIDLVFFCLKLWIDLKRKTA